MSIDPSEKKIPLFRAIALANAFAIAASKGKKAKIIHAIQHAVKHDKEFDTEFVSRIAFEMRMDVTRVKKLRVPDLKASSGLKGRLHDVFIKLANEMEETLQGVAADNQAKIRGDNRHRLRTVAPHPKDLWQLQRAA